MKRQNIEVQIYQKTTTSKRNEKAGSKSEGTNQIKMGWDLTIEESRALSESTRDLGSPIFQDPKRGRRKLEGERRRGRRTGGGGEEEGGEGARDEGAQVERPRGAVDVELDVQERGRDGRQW